MKGRLEVVNEIYYAQVQIYMAYLNLENCLFTSLNKDTSQIYAAQFERELASERIKSKRQISIHNGYWPGGHPPLGYRE